MKRIKYCERCRRYTLKEECLICREKTHTRAPQKFSKPDRFSKYRRKARKEVLIERGLL